VDSIVPYIVDLKQEIDVLLSRYKEQKKKNTSLNTEKISLVDKIDQLEIEIKELKERVEIVDLAQGISIEGSDSVSFARGRVNNLIRKIDKCISLLNE
tara:strand:+ start:28 stop:321 length:294 start_codon:yes stop_codon:yes gene_type:complete